MTEAITIANDVDKIDTEQLIRSISDAVSAKVLAPAGSFKTNSKDVIIEALEVIKDEAKVQKWKLAEAEARESRQGPTDNEVALAQIDLLKDVLQTVQSRPTSVVPQPAYYLPGVPVATGVFFAPEDPARLKAQGKAVGAWDAMAVRQPGSIIPLSTYQKRQ